MIVWIARNRQRTWLHGDLTMIYVSREVEIYIELKTKQTQKVKDKEKQRKGVKEVSV